MPIVITVKMRPRYEVMPWEQEKPSAVGFGIRDRVDSKAMHTARHHVHRRAYTLADWVALCDYMNDRIAGYPVPSKLLPMLSEHNEDRRETAKQRRRGGRRGATGTNRKS